ncbi:MAG: DNA repair protein RecO [Candidatus Humimicrobiaceae bacterium]
MAAYKAKSIVLKSYKLGETDKIIRLFSMEHGIISAIAKGAYNFKSRFSGRLELFNILDCEISSGRNLDIINQAEIIEVFGNISSDFFKFNISQITCEIILKSQSEKSPSITIFKLLYFTLREINKCKASDDDRLKKILVFFIAKFLKIMGYVPLLDSCSICGGNLFLKDKTSHGKGIMFSIKYGGAICADCRKDIDRLFFIENESAKIMVLMFSGKIENIINLAVSAKIINDLLNILENYLVFHMDIKIDSFDYLKKIEKIRL